MRTFLDGALSLAVILLALSVVGISVYRGYLRKYFFVNLYVAVMLTADAMRYLMLYRYGYRSVHYFYTYFVTDALLVAAIYLLILSFFEVIFGGTPLAGYVRWVLFFFIGIIGIISNAMISRMPHSHSYSHLMIEFLQNMYFAAVLLSVLLWISLQHLRVYDRQMGFLIAGLGLSLGVQAANWALQNLFPRDTFLQLGPYLALLPVFSTNLRLGLWCYALGWMTQEAPVLARDVPVTGRRRHVLVEAEAKGD